MGCGASSKTSAAPLVSDELSVGSSADEVPIADIGESAVPLIGEATAQLESEPSIASLSSAEDQMCWHIPQPTLDLCSPRWTSDVDAFAMPAVDAAVVTLAQERPAYLLVTFGDTGQQVFHKVGADQPDRLHYSYPAERGEMVFEFRVETARWVRCQKGGGDIQATAPSRHASPFPPVHGWKASPGARWPFEIEYCGHDREPWYRLDSSPTAGRGQTPEYPR